jgi:quinoprotein glucose dehydrogenase
MNSFSNLHLGISSAPFVVGDLVITGSHIVDETGSKSRAGDVRAWDVRTGKLVWTRPAARRKGSRSVAPRSMENQSGASV